jgi:hypothetical protein
MIGWFDDIPVIGALPREQARELLLEIGAADDAEAMIDIQHDNNRFGFFDRRVPAYRHTAHVFGYVSGAGEDCVDVRSVSELEPDLTLRSRPLKISLGKLAAVDYPGRGNHVVLCDLSVRHSTSVEAQDLHYAVVVRAAEGQRAGVLNLPVFQGVNPGDGGLSLRGFTVNVKNEQDEELLRHLESDTMRRGLTLLKTVQPALAPLSELAYGLTRSVAKRNRNVPVQDFSLGLDFTEQAFGAPLRLGAYVVVQVPGELQYAWDWSDWAYDRRQGDLIYRPDPRRGLSYNHLVFTVAAAPDRGDTGRPVA